jgi:hypothetical protein
VEKSEGFTRKNEDGREADFRLANRLARQFARAADNVGCELRFEPAVNNP